MGVLDSIDSGVSGLFGQWDVYSTGLATLLILIVSYRVIAAREPDVHPMLLARQSVPSPVRNEGESPVYRSQATPHGMPLKTGLNVKQAGASKWSAGRDGDLRDIWRRVVQGSEEGAKGKILTVLGRNNVIDHKLDDITRQINLIGQHIADQGGIRVAVYLPNSIELLVALFACSFYPNLTTVLVPFNVSDEELVSMLRRSAVDTLITAPGAFPFDAVVKAYPSLRQLIWVTDEGSSHMDWNEVPEGMGGSINVATWQDILRDAPLTAGVELPKASSAPESTSTTDVISFWQSKPGTLEEMVRFSQANLVSAIAGQLSAVPVNARMCASDLFLPAEPLTNVHTLVLTLAALYSNASVALTAVVGQTPDLAIATQGVAPTVLVASPSALLATHQESSRRLSSALAKASHAMSTRTLAHDGVHAPSNMLSVFASGAAPAIGTTPGKLRLLYVADKAGADTPHLSAEVLSDLRIFTGAKVVYALTAPRVAGAVAQTAPYDYRLAGDHFGPPLSSTEVFLKDSGAHRTTDDKTEGDIVVRGPSVAGGETNTGVPGKIREDHTLAYA